MEYSTNTDFTDSALLDLQTDDFAEGLAKMVSFFVNSKTKKQKASVSMNHPGTSFDPGNYLLLSDNSPIAVT